MIELAEPNPFAVKRKLSTRLIRKGALLEETHRVFIEWDATRSFDENLEHAREQNIPAADNESWLKEVISTISSRWRREPSLPNIVALAQSVNFDIWRPCVLWHIGQVDELYYRFATEWLYQEYQAGAFRLRTDDVVPFVQEVTADRAAGDKGLSEYGTKRAARDLLRMASDFGLLNGTVAREFRSYHLPEKSLLYVIYAIHDLVGSAQEVVASRDWRLFLMSRNDVERELFRLQQFRKLRYEVAGSLVELSLPCGSISEYIEEISS